MVCEQVRARIAEVPIELGGEMLGVTLSLGVATRQPGESGDALVARADRALYEAKSNGRNRVRLAA
jgi:diguanylate cyclase (GGDEF)-like protein